MRTFQFKFIVVTVGYKENCSSAVPDDEDIIDIVTIIYDMSSMGIVVPDGELFPVPHGNVCIAWGKISPIAVPCS